MPLLSCEEAARRLGLNARTVRLLIRNGTLPAEKVGWSWAIREKDLEKARQRPRTGRPPKKQDSTPPRRRPPVGRAS
jgi:excisionase family DNA binding protein